MQKVDADVWVFDLDNTLIHATATSSRKSTSR